MQERHRIIAQTAVRYRAATKQEKGRILDELTALTGYNCISSSQNSQKNRTNFPIRLWGFLPCPSAAYVHVPCGNSRLRIRECVHGAQGGQSSPLQSGHP